jgi:hypothetical protein
MTTNFFNSLEKNIDKVEELLKTFKKLRDNDAKLIANFWYYEIDNDKTFNEMTAEQLLHMFAQGLLTSPETITRYRRKVQEQSPALRGEKYISRHDQEEQTRNNINKL